VKTINKNQEGFGIVELLIIIFVIGLLGFVGWSVYQRTADSKGNSTASVQAKPEALMYGYFDGLAMKVNSYDLTSNQNKQLFEQSLSEPETRSRPLSVLNGQVSSNKQMVAYRFGDKGKIKIIKSDGSAVREVSRNDVESFTWLLNKNQLVLEKSNYVNCNGANCEAPLNGFRSDWYLFDVDSGTETKLDMGDNSFNGLEGQSANTLYFAANSPYGGISPKLFAYDIDSHKVTEVDGLPNEEGMQIGFIASSPGSKHTIISILPPGYGSDYNCTIYELDGKKLGSKIIDNANYQCENAFWVNDSEFYFDNSTGPSGKVSTSDTSKSGYYVLLSVFRYSFNSKKQEKVLVSDGSEVYRLMGSLPDGSFVVSNEASKRNPKYKLEIRNPDGSFKSSIDSNQKEMLLIGGVR